MQDSLATTPAGSSIDKVRGWARGLAGLGNHSLCIPWTFPLGLQKTVSLAAQDGGSSWPCFLAKACIHGRVAHPLWPPFLHCQEGCGELCGRALFGGCFMAGGRRGGPERWAVPRCIAGALRV